MNLQLWQSHSQWQPICAGHPKYMDRRRNCPCNVCNLPILHRFSQSHMLLPPLLQSSFPLQCLHSHCKLTCYQSCYTHFVNIYATALLCSLKMNCWKINFPLKSTITLSTAKSFKMKYKIHLQQIPVEICYANTDEACQTGAPLAVCGLSDFSSWPTRL